MAQSLDELYQSLVTAYRKDTDQDFPTNKIRFFMDFLWNATLAKPLTEEQKVSLKGLIDLLNSLDDHKLSPTREMISNLSPQLTPLLTTYPSLGHTFTFVATTLIPAYQLYLTSLENQVKDSHAFSKEEVILYYDMTLVDHAVLSHLFESENSLNLVEVITSIKSVITVNALTHDFLQDALNRSISLFTFLQRGGLAKEKCHEFYTSLVDQVLTQQTATVTNASANAAVEFLCKKLVELTVQATTNQQGDVPVTPPPTPTLPADVTTEPAPMTPPAPQPTQMDTMPTPEPVLPPQQVPQPTTTMPVSDTVQASVVPPVAQIPTVPVTSSPVMQEPAAVVPETPVLTPTATQPTIAETPVVSQPQPIATAPSVQPQATETTLTEITSPNTQQTQ